MRARAEPVRIDDARTAPKAAEKFAAGKLKEAATAYRKALRADPLDAVLLNNLAASLARLGHLDEAIEALTKADSLDPKNPVILDNLGMVYAASGLKQEALAAFGDASAIREMAPQGTFPAPFRDVYLWRMVARGKASWTGGRPKGSKHPLKMPPGVNVADYIIKERDALRGPE